MKEIYCRIITTTSTPATEEAVKHFVTSTLSPLGISPIAFRSFVPYWKDPGQGELSFQFLTQIPLDTIQSLFADTWQSDTADIQWSQIHCPNTAFLWISN